jgi:hypothetical protein
VKVTFAQIRNAYNAIRTIDGAPGGQAPGMALLKENLVAKSRSYRIQSALLPDVDASEEAITELRLKHAGEEGSKVTPHQELAFTRAVSKLMRQEVDVSDHLVLTDKMLGDEVMGKIPSSLLADLGPFFTWEEPGNEV